MQQSWGRVKLTEINPHLVCVLCHGYFVDATTMAECPHSFCRSCIVLYLETKSYCPICEVQIHKTKPHLNLKPDKTLQDIVYKLVPGLFHDEMRRRREFYSKYPNRDLYLSPEARGVGVERIIYSPEDSISLSLEYYDESEDGPLAPVAETVTDSSEREREEWASTRPGCAPELAPQQQKPTGTSEGMKRYLQCPAVVTMSHIKKFIRLKYGLSQACTVEILYRRESLPDSYSLMDIAYIYTWKRNEPMRFYYRIHVPTRLKTVLPPLKASSEPIRDPEPASTAQVPSPELLNAVGLRPKPPEAMLPKKLDLENGVQEDKKEPKPAIEEPPKEEERTKMSPAEDTAVSLLLALSNGHGPDPRSHNVVQPTAESKTGERQASATSSETATPPTGNGGVFKVPQSLTKRFIINGGKLVAVKSKSHGGRSSKPSEKGKPNGKMNGESLVNIDRFSNPLGLLGNGMLSGQGGRLPPGSPRPPPGSERLMKTKYMPPTGLLINRLTPEITVSQNISVPELNPKTSHGLPQPIHSNRQLKSNGSQKASAMTANGQPAHRKEVNRLEQIVQNCLKKEASQKVALESKQNKEGEVRSGAGVKRSGTLSAGSNEEGARAAHGDASIRGADHVANPSKTDHVDNTEQKETEPSILKRKLNDPSFNLRPAPFNTPNQDALNGLGDAKKRRLVTPDVSIELMANPKKDKHKEKKREQSDLSALTKRFLHDIQRMKKLDSDHRLNKVDQMCAPTVKIEKVPAPPTQTVPVPKSSPVSNEKSKSIDVTDFNSEDDQLFIDIRNKCEAMKRKNPEPVSIAIERVSEDLTTRSHSDQASPSKRSDSPNISNPETSPKLSGTHKKLPRLIEINAPPRPKLPSVIPDPKQKTGIKMTTVRKEVPINKEVPVVRRDCNGALDLSSGMSPPSGASMNGSKSPFHRPSSTEKNPSSSSLSPLLSMPSFSVPDSNRSSPIRIPTLKPKTPSTPRPSSLSSSSPSPPAEPRSNTDVFPSATYQLLYRQQMELQKRLLASQCNNNWSRDPLSTKKLEEWMRNVMNFPHHPSLYPSQLSPESGRK